MGKINLKLNRKEIVVDELKVDLIYEKIKSKEEIIEKCDELSAGKYFESLYLLELLTKEELLYVHNYYLNCLKEDTQYDIAFFHTCVLLKELEYENYEYLDNIFDVSLYNYFNYLLLGSKYNYILMALYFLSNKSNFEKIVDKFIFQRLENMTEYDEDIANKTIDNLIKNNHLNSVYSYIYTLCRNSGGITKEKFEKYTNMKIDEYIKLYYKYYYGFFCCRQLYNLYELKDNMSIIDFYNNIPTYIKEIAKYKEDEFDIETETYKAKEVGIFQIISFNKYKEIDFKIIKDIFDNEIFSIKILERYLKESTDIFLKNGDLLRFVDLIKDKNRYQYDYHYYQSGLISSKNSFLINDFVDYLLLSTKKPEELIYLYLNTYYSREFNLMDFILELSKNIDVSNILNGHEFSGKVLINLYSHNSNFYFSSIKNKSIPINNIYLYNLGYINENSHEDNVMILIEIPKFIVKEDRVIPKIVIKSLLKKDDDINHYSQVEVSNKDISISEQFTLDTAEFFKTRDKSALVKAANNKNFLKCKKCLYNLKLLDYTITTINGFYHSKVYLIYQYINRVYKINPYSKIIPCRMLTYDLLRSLFKDYSIKQKITTITEKIFNYGKIDKCILIYNNTFLKYYYTIYEFLDYYVYYKKIREVLTGFEYFQSVKIVKKISNNIYKAQFIGNKFHDIQLDEDVKVGDFIRIYIDSYDRYKDYLIVSIIQKQKNTSE